MSHLTEYNRESYTNLPVEIYRHKIIRDFLSIGQSLVYITFLTSEDNSYSTRAADCRACQIISYYYIVDNSDVIQGFNS